jgi:hypothetical protein
MPLSMATRRGLLSIAPLYLYAHQFLSAVGMFLFTSVSSVVHEALGYPSRLSLWEALSRREPLSSYASSVLMWTQRGERIELSLVGREAL